jgi:hypothetical protein
VLHSRVLREYLNLRGMKWHEVAENCIMKSFMSTEPGTRRVWLEEPTGCNVLVGEPGGK